jgi:hypothetical protein
MIGNHSMASSDHWSMARSSGGAMSSSFLGGIAVKSGVFALVLVGFVMGTGAALASSADDAKWIAQCQADNKDEKASPEVIKAYCTCMTAKMDENETKTVTQWEKTHKTEEAQCDKESGWK